MPVPPPRKVRIVDLVSRRHQVRDLRRIVDTKETIEHDTVVSLWVDVAGNGRMVLTANGHLVESEKGIGEPIRVARKGSIYEEV